RDAAAREEEMSRELVHAQSVVRRVRQLPEHLVLRERQARLLPQLLVELPVDREVDRDERAPESTLFVGEQRLMDKALPCFGLGHARPRRMDRRGNRSRPAATGATAFYLLDGELALHPGGRMARDGAEIGLATGLQRDSQLGRLAGLDERRLLPADLEVVRDVARVLHGEGHRAVRDARLRKLELELRSRDRDGC